MFEPVELNNNAIIKVIGIGGGGGNAVEYMVQEHIEGVEFFAINTDAQALRKIEVEQTIQIGSDITKGLGAGANPEIGRRAAEEDSDNLKSILKDADMVFIASGMGGGTGTGAAPIIAKISKKLGILTVAVVTKPFNFEGKKRMISAEQGVSELSKYVDSLIIIPNDKLIKVLSKGISLLDAFNTANNVLKGAVQGIAELITKPGLMNVDFADVRTVMSEMGYAMMGTGIASGDERAKEASKIAISSPLLEDINLSGAKGVLVNITSGLNMKLDEFETIGNTIRSFSSDNATVVIGTSLDTNMNDSLRVTIVATGIGTYNDIKHNNNTENHTSKHVPKNLENLQTKESPKYNNPKQHIYDTFNQQGITNKEMNYLDIPAFLRKKHK
ncbi:cell division protein FtsZ [Buchnera aphidicola str. Bp (Baizongia pistaciae)]|uniref:Cell division protein FtsZ n=1 Tax=Buchnera aphidicola subsp. Baizongia pistaciae (strain Bp) TaxID=224915 RepID=FTSZ_BUCBP|nr:cell division protein FtsZ [Buchnera aphidicola]Q89AQ5.1 RecName: Full=Cell division protein FtsZ [Buchnera aphidicola str. Bp (Baizongia pistaciae)]AAO26926.1 cell division protein FtsZ [Buchnera aphidicola str. Bp (Baizongia pistaciae)]